MKERIRLSLLVLGALVLPCAYAQNSAASAGKPADATGLCKDGTYWTGATKNGACHGHHGIKDWYSVAPASTATSPGASPETTPTPQPPSPPTTESAPSTTTQVRTQSQAAAQSAGKSGEPLATQSIKKGPAAGTTDAPAVAGGGPGLVWLNQASNVYHCPGTRYYGKTKSGTYVTEEEAKAKGAHIARHEVCTK